MRLDGQRGNDHAKVLAFQPVASSKFWSRLLGEFRGEIAKQPATPPRRGFLMLAVTVALSTMLLWQGFGKQAAVVEGFREWLWR